MFVLYKLKRFTLNSTHKRNSTIHAILRKEFSKTPRKVFDNSEFFEGGD